MNFVMSEDFDPSMSGEPVDLAFLMRSVQYKQCLLRACLRKESDFIYIAFGSELKDV
jgi:hypothetical protein